jgi:adenylate kinase
MSLASFTLEEIQKEILRKTNCEKFKPKNIILMGAPGSGKGTQADIISEKYCYCHFSSGDIFRNEVRIGTENGKLLETIMSSGGLIPNDLAFKILNIKNYMNKSQCKYGVVFDGYPRTLENVEDFENLLKKENLKFDAIIEFKVDLKNLINRVEGRRSHIPSGRIYHIKNKPPIHEGLDDITNEPLVQRKEDTKETMTKRYNAYVKETVPVNDFYKKNYSNKFYTILADQEIKNVNLELEAIINKL